MRRSTISLCGLDIPVIALDTVVVGTGCAGYNAADWLYDLGRRDFAIVTEGVNMGTSRNTGSDKQTYYKLSLASDGSDSVREMAQTLFAGGGVNGDTALIEAACSVKSFMKLANLGVPFQQMFTGSMLAIKRITIRASAQLPQAR
jgi:succinate dehydrogenase/fumarate reductase flavoprotein subunit